MDDLSKTIWDKLKWRVKLQLEGEYGFEDRLEAAIILHDGVDYQIKSQMVRQTREYLKKEFNK